MIQRQLFVFVFFNFLFVLLPPVAFGQSQSILPPDRPTDFSASSIILTIDGAMPLPPARPVWRHGSPGTQDLELPQLRPALSPQVLGYTTLPARRPSQAPVREPITASARQSPAPRQSSNSNTSGSCRAQLDALGVIYIRTPSKSEANGCNLTNAIEVSNFNGVRLRPSGFMTCDAALATARWLKDSVAPEAKQRLRKTLNAIDHYSTYSCRRRPSGKLSEHAFGNAIDIAKFHFTDGTVISIDPDWKRGGRVSRYLKSITQASCEYFSVVLSPNSDAAHYNHLHLDKGHWKSCGA